jgi:hypothetical protein
MKSVPRKPTCERCDRPREEVEGFIIIHRGGMPPRLCFGCIEDLMTFVVRERERVLEATDD